MTGPPSLLARGVDLGDAVGAACKALYCHRRTLTDQEATTPTDCAPPLSIACGAPPNAWRSGYLWARCSEPYAPARSGTIVDNPEVRGYNGTQEQPLRGSLWYCGGRTQITLGLGPEWSSAD